MTSGWPCVVIRESRDVSGVLGISVEGIPLPLCRDGQPRGGDEVVARGVYRRFCDYPITSEFASDAMVTGKRLAALLCSFIMWLISEGTQTSNQQYVIVPYHNSGPLSTIAIG